MEINLKDFHYDLPKASIAAHPLENRDQSKLLIYHKGRLLHEKFNQITQYLPKESLLFFNNTRVIPARLFFQKGTGALIEVFLLQPKSPTNLVNLAMQTRGYCEWQCMVGNLRKWKAGEYFIKTVPLGMAKLELKVELIDKVNKTVAFHWDARFTFAEIIEAAGEVPLPPYIKRKATAEDKPRYQTIYSTKEGAVAAPTAGLHFTEEVLMQLDVKCIAKDYLTLHVGAGTFLPITEAEVTAHPMHKEQVVVNRQNLQNLLQPGREVIAVGTTSVRTLESLYWFGIKLLKNGPSEFRIEKLYPYQFTHEALPSYPTAIQAVLAYMQQQNLQEIVGETEIFIMPGYQFRICRGMVTNFHMPGSTLILLVAAFVGEDWRKIYAEALQNNYRFLSYGDSSLLIP